MITAARHPQRPRQLHLGLTAGSGSAKYKRLCPAKRKAATSHRAINEGLENRADLPRGAVSAPSFARTPLDLKGLRGHVVYVDFWASWCTPCRESFPWMKTLESTYGSQGLSVIAVDLDHDRADAQRFLGVFRPNFEVIFDPAGTLAERFNVIGMPTSVLIDRQGKIRYIHVGFLLKQRAEYERQVRELLAQK